MKSSIAVVFLSTLLAPTALCAQSYSRTETITYHDDLDIWVTGQTKSVTCTAAVPVSAACDGGTDSVMSATTFDATYAIPTQRKAFSRVKQTVGYDLSSAVLTGQRGTVKTVADGRGYVTDFSSWKRGVPQQIDLPGTSDQPDGSFRYAAVNNDGTISQVTDENGFVTKYQYDAMGRLTLTDYPDGDSVAWTSTARDFAFKPGIYGLPSHWRLWEYTGSGYKVTRYDALWRPVVEESYINGVASSYSIVVKRYDTAGRLAFQSYPLRSLTSWTDTTLKGSYYAYDSLDRVTSLKQDWEGTPQLTTTTAYLSNSNGHYLQVTNPRLQWSRTWYQNYDQPSYDNPVITQTSAGQYTYVTRDPFGKPTKLRRSNSNTSTGGTGIDRLYAYNTYQELCASREPETGDSYFGFDGAGNLAWSASGFTSASVGCVSGATAASRRVDRTYDARNRIKSLVFPDGLGNTTYEYEPDGLLSSLTADNLGGNQVTNTYTYNRRRLLTEERMLWGSINWPIAYAYNTNGHLASSTSVGGLVVDYAPNALGQPTKAGTYATGVTYHPNGAIAQFTYGNGIVHTLTQNARQLPDTSTDAYGATKFIGDSYDYDENANVSAITDGATGRAFRGNRDMQYDGLDRLTRVDSPMFGTATYTYDALDNLTRTSISTGVGARNHYYCYNAQWQVAFLRSGATCIGSTPSPAVTALEYDLQGNLKERNSTGYVFDYGNRLRSTSAPATTYVYDGHGRRARDFVGGSKYSFYTQAGELAYSSDVRTSKQNWYIQLGGSLVAVRERDSGTGAVAIEYQHTDALGSPSVVTSASRGVIERREYEPYGRQLTPTPQDGPGYTGHVYDAAIGMNYMQQRYYDPSIGRFLSVDPVTAYDKGDMRFFNRYAYAFNNPHTFTDPDGRCPDANPCHESTPSSFFRDNLVGRFIASLVGDPIAVLRSDNLNPLTNQVLSLGEIQDAKLGMVLLAAPLARLESGAAKLADDALVARGGSATGANSVDGLAKGTGTHPSGVTGFSAESANGATLCQLCFNMPSRYNQVGVTTVGSVRAAGGDVVSTAGRSPTHATVTGLTPEAANRLLTPTRPNPLPRP